MEKPTYAWRDIYVSAVLETVPEIRFVKICEALEAIEQRRLGLIETEEERSELENALYGVRALISESNDKFVN